MPDDSRSLQYRRARALKVLGYDPAKLYAAELIHRELLALSERVSAEARAIADRLTADGLEALQSENAEQADTIAKLQAKVTDLEAELTRAEHRERRHYRQIDILKGEIKDLKAMLDD